MSEQQAPDRTVRGFGAARPGGGVHPDARRLLARNRTIPSPTAPEPTPAPAPELATATPATRTTAETSADTTAGTNAAVRALRSSPDVSPRREPTHTTGVKAQVNVMVPIDLRARIRSAYRATTAQEGHRSFSDFVAGLLEAEATRLEDRYNHGQPFAGGQEPLPPGRPLDD